MPLAEQLRTVGALSLLRAGANCVVLDSRGGRLPAVLHWGTDLGDMTAEDLEQFALAACAPFSDSRIDVPERVSMIATPAEGWVGTPGLSGSRGGTAFSPSFTVTDEHVMGSDEQVAAGRRWTATDETAGLELTLELELMHGGLLRTRAAVTNQLAEIYELQSLTIGLPVPAAADEVFDMTGRHTMERIPQRGPFRVGTHLRESRKGKPGLDFSYLLAAGATGFGFTEGRVWGLHVGWSGNQTAYAERTFNGFQTLAGGELLLPGEVRLAADETYRSPWVYASYGDGLNDLAGRFHHYLRSRPSHPSDTRKVLVNTWEAVYFDQDLAGLTALAKAAAGVGIERFVLDDGWFLGRRHDRAGLGDWEVDPAVWPDGLHPLVDAVHATGMDFGLWVEPEMINLDSDLARTHPEWIFRAGDRDGLPSRHQHVLDLGHPAAYQHIAERLHALLDTYPIAFLKWDHNRTVVEAGHQPDGTPGVHRHTAAVYRLLDELRSAHPGLEIESCAGGGGRIDLGIMDRADRVWPSDCIDPLERQQILRYTMLLLPPELLGTHLGAPTSHTTHRTHSLPFRAAAALWGHMGIEWNLATASPADRTLINSWVALHKSLRPLLHTGSVVVADHPDPAIWVNGVVATDRSEAVFGITSVARSVTWPPGKVRFPGLDPDLRYRVTPLTAGDPGPTSMVPAWWSSGVTLTGRLLGVSGVQVPALFPENTCLIRLVAVS